MTHLPTSPEAQPLCPRRHRTLRLADGDAAFGFARQRQWLPLALAELPHACLDYPCLFQPSADGHCLVALLGLRRRENLFVDQAGVWVEGCWVPAVGAAHPFSLDGSGGSGPAALCVDAASPRLGTVHGRRLFSDEGLPSPLLHEQLALLVACRDEIRRARGFAGRLAALDLLVPQPVHFDNGRFCGQVDGLWQVDEARLAALPSPMQALHASGDLARVHAHLLSLHQVPRLAHRLANASSRTATLSRWPVVPSAMAQAASARRRQTPTLVS